MSQNVIRETKKRITLKEIFKETFYRSLFSFLSYFLTFISKIKAGLDCYTCSPVYSTPMMVGNYDTGFAKKAAMFV